MSVAAEPAVVARVLALARRLAWRVVFAGPGGPIELHLRQALAGAVAHLQSAGVPLEKVTAALAAYGMGSGPRSYLPAMPSGGAEVVACALAAMAAEGARMLDEGRAQRPVDIDAVALMKCMGASQRFILSISIVELLWVGVAAVMGIAYAVAGIGNVIGSLLAERVIRRFGAGASLFVAALMAALTYASISAHLAGWLVVLIFVVEATFLGFGWLPI